MLFLVSSAALIVWSRQMELQAFRWSERDEALSSAMMLLVQVGRLVSEHGGLLVMGCFVFCFGWFARQRKGAGF